MSTTPDAEREVDRLLKSHRAKLTRHNKHEVWKLPNGQTFVRACTPSDVHTHDNQLRDLKHVLGLFGTRGLPGVRREARNKPGAERGVRITASANGTLQEKLRSSGLVEDSLNAKIAVLKAEMQSVRRATTRRRRALSALDAHCVKCWACRLWRWWKRLRNH